MTYTQTGNDKDVGGQNGQEFTYQALKTETSLNAALVELCNEIPSESKRSKAHDYILHYSSILFLEKGRNNMYVIRRFQQQWQRLTWRRALHVQLVTQSQAHPKLTTTSHAIEYAHVTFDDGHACTFSNSYLRDNCSCEECFHQS